LRAVDVREYTRGRKKPAAKKKSPAKRARETRVCLRCGASEDCLPGGIPAGWSIDVEGKRVRYVCVGCVRQNLRAIEGKLPEEYWEW
jgi:hypothetical protein